MKKVGKAIYSHVSAIDVLPKAIQERVANAVTLLPLGWHYDIIKITPITVSFIQSPDWDCANEPTVGDAYCIGESQTIKLIKACGKVYHHKWMFVKSDYSGFDIEASKKRSKLWQSVLKNEKNVTRFIGNRKFWVEILKKYGLSE